MHLLFFKTYDIKSQVLDNYFYIQSWRCRRLHQAHGFKHMDFQSHSAINLEPVLDTLLPGWQFYIVDIST